MADGNFNPDIIHTKLFRPTVADDIVFRARLFTKLDKGSKCRLTLVSAPAGYGKSILVSSWLESIDRPHGWLSLDEEISDLNTFLRYFLFAIRELFPAACPNTLALLSTPDPQSPQTLSAELIKELSEIKTPSVLVLDDYGFIHDSEIHEMFSQVLQYAPSSLQLIVLTRRDPPFSLQSFRARGEIVEIRQKDLQFTMPEMAAFLNTTTGIDLDKSAQTHVHDKIEGWAVGLRLIALSLDNRDDVNEFLREMKGDTRHIHDYLVSEVLSRQSPTVREGLLKTSILNRFCASLCKALCHPSCGDLCGPECDGQVFMDKLEESNLFCIVLDERHEWLRYHHLFQQLLQRTLESRYSPDEIATLHDQACSWFEENGMIEEAFHHALIGSGPEVAGKLVARYRHELMNKEQWQRLGRLMDLLPRAIVENNPELLIQDAWILWNRMRIQEMAKVLDQVEALLAPMSKELTTPKEMQGEVAALRSIQYYLVSPCDGPRALACAQKAMQEIPPHHFSTKGLAIIVLAMSYQLTGNRKGAFEVVFEELTQKQVQQRNTYHTRLLVTLCFIYWLEADLDNLKQTGKRLLELGNELHLSESSCIGKYFSGLNHYCRNELSEADKYLTEVVDNRNKINIFNFAHCSFVLSLTRQAQGGPSEACEIAESVVRYALDTSNAPLLQLAHAFQAELALRQGNIAKAVSWSKNYEPEPFGTAHRFYVPQLTLVRVLLAQNTPESKKQAADLLPRLHDFYESINNMFCLINVLALQAMLYNALGDEPAALAALERAINLAEPGGSIRIFLDLDPTVTDLLQRLADRGIAIKYIGSLLAAFQEKESGSQPDSATEQTTDSATSGDQSLPANLTNREIEILSLLARRLSNKEVSTELFISPTTVKRHTINLYKKLDVHGRREAVDKATSLGIIT